jgi:hypothetical protein
VRLVGFTIEIYYDAARSYKRQKKKKGMTIVAGLLARSQYPEVPVTGHLGTSFSSFPLSQSECSDGSQHSKLLLHASHVALQN